MQPFVGPPFASPLTLGHFRLTPLSAMTMEQGLGLGITAIMFLAGGIDFLLRWWLERHRDRGIKDLTDKLTVTNNVATELRLKNAEQADRIEELTGKLGEAAQVSERLVMSEAELAYSARPGRFS